MTEMSGNPVHTLSAENSENHVVASGLILHFDPRVLSRRRDQRSPNLTGPVMHGFCLSEENEV